MRSKLTHGIKKNALGRQLEYTSAQAEKILKISRTTLWKYREVLKGEERVVNGKRTWVFPAKEIGRYKPPKGFAPPVEVAEYLMISRQALHKRIKRGTYPIYRRDPFPALVWHPGIDLSKPEHRG